MDEVQLFIAKNRHQYGYIMQEASRQWIAENPSGALTVGPCNFYIEKFGDYHKLQDELERLQKEIEYLKEANSINSVVNQSMNEENLRLTAELIESYEMQIRGMIYGRQLDWVKNRINELTKR